MVKERPRRLRPPGSLLGTPSWVSDTSGTRCELLTRRMFAEGGSLGDVGDVANAIVFVSVRKKDVEAWGNPMPNAA